MNNQNKILRWPEVNAATGLSRSTIWRMEQLKQFPARRMIGQKNVGWLSSEVSEWIQSREVIASDREANL